MVVVSGRTDPDTKQYEVYSRKYRNYKRAIKALDSYWNEI